MTTGAEPSLAESLRRQANACKFTRPFDSYRYREAATYIEAQATRIEAYEKALTAIRDHDGVSYRFGDEVRKIASDALAASLLNEKVKP